MGHSQGDDLTNPMLITAFEGHREPCNEVGSLSLVERLAAPFSRPNRPLSLNIRSLCFRHFKKKLKDKIEGSYIGTIVMLHFFSSLD